MDCRSCSESKVFHVTKKQICGRIQEQNKSARPLRKDELKEVYAKADIFVFPSRMESFGIVLLEAMASKLPIISTDVGAARELIINKKNGFIISIGDWKAMASYIERLLADANLRRTMGENNWKLVEEKFRADATYAKLLELYDVVKDERKIQLNERVRGCKFIDEIGLILHMVRYKIKKKNIKMDILSK